MRLTNHIYRADTNLGTAPVLQLRFYTVNTFQGPDEERMRKDVAESERSRADDSSDYPSHHRRTQVNFFQKRAMGRDAKTSVVEFDVSTHEIYQSLSQGC